MFYCELCRAGRLWPKSEHTSKGVCEICQQEATLYNVAQPHIPTLVTKPKSYLQHLAQERFVMMGQISAAQQVLKKLLMAQIIKPDDYHFMQDKFFRANQEVNRRFAVQQQKFGKPKVKTYTDKFGNIIHDEG